MNPNYRLPPYPRDFRGYLWHKLKLIGLAIGLIFGYERKGNEDYD